MQKLGSYSVHSQRSELVRVYIKLEKHSESAELSRPPGLGALIIMHMLKMALSPDDKDDLKRSWIQMVIQNITKMYLSVPGPMINIF